jgi:ferritin-like metal-binding protein YciE
MIFNVRKKTLRPLMTPVSILCPPAATKCWGLETSKRMIRPSTRSARLLRESVPQRRIFKEGIFLVVETVMELQSLQDLYVEQLRDLYNAENQLISALPKMAKAAADPQLQEAFESHLEQTRGHAERIEHIFDRLGMKPKGQKCKAMEGLIEEGKEMIDMDGEPEIRDAGLVACAQRVEHYEIAGYGCVRTYARLLNDREGERLLQQTLEEEAQTDKNLTKLADSVLNRQAASHAPMA